MWGMRMEMTMLNLITLILQIAIGLALTYLSIYIGMYVLKFVMFVRTKKDLNISGNLKVGNVAMAILVAAMAVGIALMAQVGLSFMFPGTSELDAYLLTILKAEVLVMIGILLAVFLIGISEAIMNRTFPKLNILDEIRNGNVAMSLVMSTIIIIVCLFGRSALYSIAHVIGL